MDPRSKPRQAFNKLDESEEILLESETDKTTIIRGNVESDIKMNLI